MDSTSISEAAARPSRAQVDPAAQDLIRRRGAEIMATARRYAHSREDAEDAYQRALEILLTKAPSTDEDQLVPWLKTVVKHEAFALKRQRDRAVLVEDDKLDVIGAPESGLEDRAEALDRLRVGAEAMQRLKPHETRALLLKAEGYSYKQIQDITGWTYTKVNRCLTEGRRSFLERVSAIESGSECERLAPLLSKLADGEADADDMAALRPHLRGCKTCKATLRDYRDAPAAAAAIALPGALVGAEAMGSEAAGGVPGLDAASAWMQERFYFLSTKLQALFEVATAHKAAAIAASTVAIAGGGAATAESLRTGKPERAPEAAERPPKPRAAAAPAVSSRRREVLPAADDERRAPRRRVEGPATPREPVAGATAAPPDEPVGGAWTDPSPAPTRPPPAEAPPPEVEGGEFGP